VSPDEIELLRDLTILIPTCNRPLKLERAIEYWRDLPVTLHVLDGSVEPALKSGEIENCEGHIKYHSIPPLTNETFMENYARRLVVGMNLIKTPVAALLADDDYFLLPGLCKALKTLLNDSEVDAVIGKCATYFFDKNKITWQKKWTNWFNTDSLKDSSLSVRLNNDPGKYFIYYGVLRSEKLKLIHNRANEYVFSDFRINELVTHHLGLACCRVELIEEYLWAREKPIQKNSAYDPKIRVENARDEFVLEEIFVKTFSELDNSVSPEEYKLWANQKVQLINDRLRRDGDRQSRAEEFSYAIYLKNFIKRYMMYSLIKIPERVRGRFFIFLPHKMRNAIEIASPPDSSVTSALENFLLAPREELRLRANI